MEILLLSAVAFLAATIQAATGFGFGLIAVSAFLVILNSIAAIQIVIIITLIVSILHWPKLRKFTPDNTMRWLIMGGALGFPVGIYILSNLDLRSLKTIIAVLIILISLQTIWLIFNAKKTQGEFGQDQKPSALSVAGFASGLMTISIAMPGPPVMLYLSRTKLQKDEIRAVISSFFVFAFTGALITQAIWFDIETQTWVTAAYLCPAAIIGTVAGDKLSTHLNPKIFKLIVLGILLITGVFMLANL